MAARGVQQSRAVENATALADFLVAKAAETEEAWREAGGVAPGLAQDVGLGLASIPTGLGALAEQGVEFLGLGGSSPRPGPATQLDQAVHARMSPAGEAISFLGLPEGGAAKTIAAAVPFIANAGKATKAAKRAYDLGGAEASNLRKMLTKDAERAEMSRALNTDYEAFDKLQKAFKQKYNLPENASVWESDAGQFPALERIPTETARGLAEEYERFNARLAALPEEARGEYRNVPTAVALWIKDRLHRLGQDPEVFHPDTPIVTLPRSPTEKRTYSPNPVGDDRYLVVAPSPLEEAIAKAGPPNFMDREPVLIGGRPLTDQELAEAGANLANFVSPMIPTSIRGSDFSVAQSLKNPIADPEEYLRSRDYWNWLEGNTGLGGTPYGSHASVTGKLNPYTLQVNPNYYQARGINYRAPRAESSNTTNLFRGKEPQYTFAHESGHALHGSLAPGDRWDLAARGSALKKANNLDADAKLPDVVRKELEGNSQQVRAENWSYGAPNPMQTLARGKERDKHLAYLASEEELLADAEARLRLDPAGFKKDMPRFAEMFRNMVKKTAGFTTQILKNDYTPLSVAAMAMGAAAAREKEEAGQQ